MDAEERLSVMNFSTFDDLAVVRPLEEHESELSRIKPLTPRNNLPGIVAHKPNVFIFIIRFLKLITGVRFPSPLLLTKPLKKGDIS
jgi:hypothetical protein